MAAARQDAITKNELLAELEANGLLKPQPHTCGEAKDGSGLKAAGLC